MGVMFTLKSYLATLRSCISYEYDTTSLLEIILKGTDISDATMSRWINGSTKSTKSINAIKENRDTIEITLIEQLDHFYDYFGSKTVFRDLVLGDYSLSISKKHELLEGLDDELEEKRAEDVTQAEYWKYQDLKKEDKALYAQWLYDLFFEALCRPTSQSESILIRKKGSCLPAGQRYFSGREIELEELHTLLRKYGKVFVQGLAGIGKSEFVKQYAHKYRDEYHGRDQHENIVYIFFDISQKPTDAKKTKRDSTSELVKSLKEYIAEIIFDYDNPDDDIETRFQKHYRDLLQLEDDSLIIIDNFDVDISRDPMIERLLNELRCHVLITTRCVVDARYESYVLNAMDEADLFELVKKIYPKAERYANEINESIKILQYHTLCVSLYAHLLQNGIKTPGELLRGLKSTRFGLQSKDKIKINYDHKKVSGSEQKKETINYSIGSDRAHNQTFQEYLQILFSKYSFPHKNSEWAVLRNFVLMPLSGVSKKYFAHMAGIDSLVEINAMVDNGVIIKEGDIIRVHPLIRDLSISQTKPSIASCKALIDNLCISIQQINLEFEALTASEALIYSDLMGYFDIATKGDLYNGTDLIKCVSDEKTLPFHNMNNSLYEKEINDIRLLLKEIIENNSRTRNNSKRLVSLIKKLVKKVDDTWALVLYRERELQEITINILQKCTINDKKETLKLINHIVRYLPLMIHSALNDLVYDTWELCIPAGNASEKCFFSYMNLDRNKDFKYHKKLISSVLLIKTDQIVGNEIEATQGYLWKIAKQCIQLADSKHEKEYYDWAFSTSHKAVELWKEDTALPAEDCVTVLTQIVDEIIDNHVENEYIKVYAKIIESWPTDKDGDNLTIATVYIAAARIYLSLKDTNNAKVLLSRAEAIISNQDEGLVQSEIMEYIRNLYHVDRTLDNTSST